MWHGAGAKPDAIRALKQVKKGDRILCYHSAPERSLYSIAEVTRDPYPDPHDYDGKNLVADLRAFEKLPRSVTLAEMRANPALRKVKLLKNVRLIISPVSETEYQELLRMAGIVAMPGVPYAATVQLYSPRFSFSCSHRRAGSRDCSRRICLAGSMPASDRGLAGLQSARLWSTWSISARA